MQRIKKAKLKSISIIKGYVDKYNSGNLDYTYNLESFYKYVLKGNCYFLMDDSNNIGIAFINYDESNIYIIPIIYDALFSNLIEVIKDMEEGLDVKGFTLILKATKNDSIVDKLKGSFNIKAYKYMYLDLSSSVLYNNYLQDLEVYNTRIENGREERLRVQNRIFDFQNKFGRVDLTLDEIIIEETSPVFIEELCLLLKYQNEFIGYGQVIYNNHNYFLVNFGIIPEYQKKGLSKVFLSMIINKSIQFGVDTLHLTVDGDNDPAYNLYKNSGFKRTYDIILLILNN